MNIKFPREYYATGRNGEFRQAGLIVKHKKRKGARKADADIAICPMKVDGSAGAAVMYLPLSAVPTLINQLTKIKLQHETDFIASSKKLL